MTIPLVLRGPAFYQWLPIGIQKGLYLRRDDLELSLWFDAKSAVWASNLSEEDILNSSKVTAHRIYADITTTMDDIELLSYMSSRDFSRAPSEDEEPLAELYKTHGMKVFSLLQDGVNRFLTFVRVEKGQFWLDSLEIDLDNISSHSTEFGARAQVDNGAWFRWKPSQTIPLRAEVHIGQNPRFLTPSDWPEAQAFVSSERRPNLTRQLLASAEAFADTGNNRVALTEAVSALEVALNRFAASPKPDHLLPETVRSRMRLTSLSNIQERLGLTASVSLLLPMLFDQSTLSGESLDTCRDAIAERQNVVHGGQRRVVSDKLQRYLREIRLLCDVLENGTAA
jgi:hypothetical protein